MGFYTFHIVLLQPPFPFVIFKGGIAAISSHPVVFRSISCLEFYQAVLFFNRALVPIFCPHLLTPSLLEFHQAVLFIRRALISNFCLPGRSLYQKSPGSNFCFCSC